MKKIFPQKTGRSKAVVAASSSAPDLARPEALFIVGVGASAGGLEALEQFFRPVPADSGLAFVVVQHLDPKHKGILVELLQRVTAVPIVEIQDGMRCEPDHVYVIPSNRDLSVLHGELHLMEPVEARGLRLPIDLFLRSLAADQQERSVGVILSGMGADGTLGLRAIKEVAGAVFVQTPATAKFDSMPRSAIDAGLADVVAPAEALAGRIIAYRRHAPLLLARSAQKFADSDQSGLAKVILLLRAKTGHDFSLYKKSTIYRRIERRMGLHQLRKITDYVRHLRENPAEADLLFNDLLIGVTSFFRDPAVWEQLRTEAIPALLAARPKGGTLRAWVPACSTGEEAYSLAVIFREALEAVKPEAHYTLQIFATDLDKNAIATARTGVYPANIAAEVGPVRLARFFRKEGGGFHLSKEIRDMVIFAPQNLVMDPPFTKLDLLTCRNLLIYLEADLQEKILPLFHYSLNADGLLVLGTSETAGRTAELFAPLAGKTRIFRRRESLLRGGLADFPPTLFHTSGGAQKNGAVMAAPVEKLTASALQTLTESLLIKRFSPPAVLVTEQGELVYVSGKIGQYFEPAVGRANLNVLAMARAGLAEALEEVFSRAVRQGTPIELKAVKVGADGGSSFVDVLVEPMTAPAALRGMVLLVFTASVASSGRKVPDQPGKSASPGAREALLMEELQQSREEIQRAREEMQGSLEELKSTNEELQSTNEELQSTNEEMMTSKEEMQSMNEELHTVNQELQAKVSELSRADDDMKNLLNSTAIATVFLDRNLRLRRFTEQAITLFHFIPGDVGRPITDLSSDLHYPEFADDVAKVLRTLVTVERSLTAQGGRWLAMRLMPYRTVEDRIDGVVITFMDITVAKQLEAALRSEKGAGP